jgi:uncharacterized protein (TIGR02271 family)
MIEHQEVQGLMTGGGNVVTETGEKIGSIGQIYLDDVSSRPEWVTVKTGMFGTAESFVPLERARVEGSDICVPYDKNQVKDAPRIDDNDGHLSESAEADLYRYYGLDHSGRTAPTADAEEGHDSAQTSEVGMGQSGQAGAPGAVGDDTSGPTTDDAMTRSEERMNVGTQSQEAGRVRLRKWVETEQVTTTVPVAKEKAVVEREPITEANRDKAVDGPAISDEEHEIVLHEERPVVEKVVEPVERVRVGKQTVTDEETVSGDVRKEQIGVEGDTDQV